MVKHKQQEPEPIMPKEFANIEEIEMAITKLTRRIEDVKALETQKVVWEDQRKDDVEFSIRETIREIFGQNSPEFNKYRYCEIWDGGHYMMRTGEEQNSFESGIKKTVLMLEGLIKRIEEKRGDLSIDVTARIKTTFEGSDLHQRIANVAHDLYADGHYFNAVSNSTIALVNYVKEKSGRFDLDGAPLMTTVFSKNKPILSFNDLVDQTDFDEQEGMMHLFLGVVLGIRNPRAHNLFDDDPQRALEYIVLISHLAKRLDESKKSK